MADHSSPSPSALPFSAVITGGLGDIGQAIALRLARKGTRVTLLDLHANLEGQRITRELGHDIQYAKCNVADRSDVERVFSTFPRLDVVIANAGIVRAGSFLTLSTQDWLDTLTVNLTGAFHTAQAAAQRMVEQAPTASGVRGRILFTGSWVQDMPHPGTFAYITSKGGLKMLAKTMAQELASHSILVNVVAPGAVKAGLTKQLADKDEAFRKEMLAAVPLGSFQSVDSVAAAFAYLCSPDADYMTGSTLLIDGGLSLVRYT
jgi:NAD(P)-dependent dehydrogenase (short-subunit alcohol dehydrogenase family)